MRREVIRAAGALLIGASLLAGAASAAEVKATGTLVMKDRYFSRTEWGTGLSLPRDGRITRVMDGTYGFTIRDAGGREIASFLDPQQAVGLRLVAGDYTLEPFVCTRHRHHHVEVTAEY